ncbi:MAG: pilus assembly protein TadG-related protein [Zavarzinella sp.]
MKRIDVKRRSGAVLPLVAICLVALMAFMALAIDIGMMAVARTQAQSAADVAALAGARTLNGLPGNNVTNATAESREAARSNSILNAQITNAQVTTTQVGIYRYDTAANRFQAVFGSTPASNEAYGAMQVSLTTAQPTFFGKILGVNSLTIGAQATAVHRPRDISVVLDFSGSMRFSSEFNYPSGSSDVQGALNPDDRYPRFGPWIRYQPVSGTNVNPLQRLTAYIDGGGETHAVNNLTVETTNGPPVIDNFMTTIGAGANAFVYNGDLTGSGFNISNTPVCTPTPDTWSSQYASGYVGDRWPQDNRGTSTNPSAANYAKHVADLLNISSVNNGTRNATWESTGYDGINGLNESNTFLGYSMGPAYYGKTFYMWPPDPREDKDWRKRFYRFRSSSSSTKGPVLDDNTALFDSTGRFYAQYNGSTPRYVPDYDNILAWIKSGPQVLPPALRAGRVRYYDEIPDTLPIDWNTGRISGSATLTERFWKEYIDFVIGAGRHNMKKTLTGYPNNNTFGGTTFGSTRITAKSSLYGTSGNPPPYMRYDDCPVHPIGHFWFGPYSMLGFLAVSSNTVSYNWFAGTTYEAQTWQLKAGIQSALEDIRLNHPNDLASLIYFSSHNSYNSARVDMGKDYTRMKNALFYPNSLLNSLGNTSSEMVPYRTASPSSSNPSGFNPANYAGNVPLADGGTNPTMGLMNAYNEFNWVGSATGRNGATKIVILETDGVANQTCNGSLSQVGSTGRYQWSSISNGSGVGNGHPDALNEGITLAWIIAQNESGSNSWPVSFPSGNSRTRKFTAYRARLLDKPKSSSSACFGIR